MTQQIDILCYDLDGTLSHSLPDIFQAMNLTLEKFNYPTVPENKVRDFIGNGLLKLVERSVSWSLSGDADYCVAPSLIQNFFKDFRKIYQSYCTDKTTLYPDVIETLEYFKHKTQVLITNKPEAMTHEILKHFSINNYFDLVICGDTLDVKKPDKKVMEYLIQQLNINPDKTKLLMIGDSDVDILTVKNTPFLSAAVSYGYTDENILKSHNPDYYIQSLPELKKYIV